MANQEHVEILGQGSAIWYQWRQAHPAIRPDLSEAILSGATLGDTYLRDANLSGADLRDANLSEATLIDAVLSGANLSGANLSEAILSGAILTNATFSYATLSYAYLGYANLSSATLSYANLSGADLTYATLRDANLRGANLRGATIAYTIFGNVDLREVEGLETLTHRGPSTIGLDTIYKSYGQIPETFLKEAGVPESFITYMRSLTGSMQPIEYYTCFISYSSKDEDFAKRLYADLQREKVRCWFAPEDMKIGDEIRIRIDESIRVYDKLLLVLSEHSVKSAWVEDEVEAALEKERLARARGERQTVLFPIQLDEKIKDVTSGWPAKIRRTRHIGNFTCWKNHDEYQKAFTRLLADLKAAPKKIGEA